MHSFEISFIGNEGNIYTSFFIDNNINENLKHLSVYVLNTQKYTQIETLKIVLFLTFLVYAEEEQYW